MGLWDTITGAVHDAVNTVSSAIIGATNAVSNVVKSYGTGLLTDIGAFTNNPIKFVTNPTAAIDNFMHTPVSNRVINTLSTGFLGGAAVVAGAPVAAAVTGAESIGAGIAAGMSAFEGIPSIAKFGAALSLGTGSLMGFDNLSPSLILSSWVHPLGAVVAEGVNLWEGHSSTATNLGMSPTAQKVTAGAVTAATAAGAGAYLYNKYAPSDTVSNANTDALAAQEKAFLQQQSDILATQTAANNKVLADAQNAAAKAAQQNSALTPVAQVPGGTPIHPVVKKHRKAPRRPGRPKAKPIKRRKAKK